MIFRSIYKNITIKILITIVVSFLIVLLSKQANANMFGLFKKYDVHLCPVVQGKVTLNGEPVSNQQMVRSLTYGNDDEQIDTTISDHEGIFYFPEKNIRSSRPGSMFDESTVRQIVLLERDGKKYLLWYSDTFGIQPAKAISERLVSLNCDLSNEEKTFEFPSTEHPKQNHFTYSICRW